MGMPPGEHGGNPVGPCPEKSQGIKKKLLQGLKGFSKFFKVERLVRNNAMKLS